VTADEVTAVLRGRLGSRYTITPGTEIEVSPGATYFGLIRLAHRIGLVRKIHNALAQAPELA
jgi:hypothetical protein